MIKIPYVLTAAAIGLTSIPASAPLAEPLPLSAAVYVINQAILSRCVKSDSINLALINAAAQPDTELGERDITRVLNTCSQDYRMPRRTAFSAISIEAIKSQSCADSECTDEEKEALGNLIFDANKNYADAYAEALLPALKASCEKFADTSCVLGAIQMANSNMEPFDHEWLHITEDHRIMGVGELTGSDDAPVVSGSKIATSVQDMHSATVVAYPSAPSGDLKFGSDEYSKYQTSDFTISEAGLSNDDLSATVSVRFENNFWKYEFPVTQQECKAIFRNVGKFGAEEVYSGVYLISSKADEFKVCTSTPEPMTAVYSHPE